MRILLFIPVLGVAIFAISCRTAVPLDPMTMKPSQHCMPDHFKTSSSYGVVHGEK